MEVAVRLIDIFLILDLIGLCHFHVVCCAHSVVSGLTFDTLQVYWIVLDTYYTSNFSTGTIVYKTSTKHHNIKNPPKTTIQQLKLHNGPIPHPPRNPVRVLRPAIPPSVRSRLRLHRTPQFNAMGKKSQDQSMGDSHGIAPKRRGRRLLAGISISRCPRKSHCGISARGAQAQVVSRRMVQLQKAKRGGTTNQQRDKRRCSRLHAGIVQRLPPQLLPHPLAPPRLALRSRRTRTFHAHRLHFPRISPHLPRAIQDRWDERSHCHKNGEWQFGCHGECLSEKVFA